MFDTGSSLATMERDLLQVIYKGLIVLYGVGRG